MEDRKRASYSLSKRRALELGFYAAWILALIGYALAVTSPHLLALCAKYKPCRRFRTESFLTDMRVDIVDVQFYKFRRQIPTILTVAAVYLPLAWLVRTACCTTRAVSSGSNADEGAADLRLSAKLRRAFLILSSIGFCLYTQGPKFVFLQVVIAINFALGRTRSPLLTWLFGITMLFLNEFRRDLFGFDALSPSLEYLNTLWPEVHNWHKIFSLILLRMISFNMDYKWTCDDIESRRAGNGALIVVNEAKYPRLSQEWRVQTPRPLSDFSYFNYFIYLLYVPLILSGPTMTFNSFMSQVYTCTPARARDIATYALRLVVCLVVFELLASYLPTMALGRDQRILSQYTPFEAGATSYFMLKITWLKFLLIWRMFRLWAMLDGVDVVENMNRCMSNNYSLGGFWRAWHRSFNRWLVRYIYVPIGGRSANVARTVFNIFVVFTFVAVWHEINLKLLTWGWLLGLFFVPELVAGALFSKKGRLAWMTGRWYWRHLRAAGAAANIFMLMIANLIGYRVGVQGLADILSMIVEPTFLFGTFFTLFGAAHIMFELREFEAAKGAPLIQDVAPRVQRFRPDVI